MRPWDSLVVDGVAVHFLAPDSLWMSGTDDANEASVVALVRFGAVRMLLTGDAERGEEAWLVRNARDRLRADILKVGHHGSRTSSTVALLGAWRPQIALISAGRGNTFGHPAPEVLERLASIGARVYRTDLDGQITLDSDGRSVSVRTFTGGER